MDFRLAEETVGRLLELPSPFEQTNWAEDNAAYLDDCGFDDGDVAGLAAVLEAWATDSAEADEVFFDDDEGAAAITAWRLLGKLKAVQALPAMLARLALAEEDEDISDWETEDLPDALALLGPDAAEDLIAFAFNGEMARASRTAVLTALQKMGASHADVAQRLSPRIVAGLEAACDNPVLFNTQLVAISLDWKLVEAAEAIERAFSQNRIDCGYAGDWNDVRGELGVPGIGLPMPEKPFNTMDDFCRNVGIGIFSKKMLFSRDGINDQAVRKYLHEACRRFEESSEGKQVLGPRQASHLHLFLDMAVNCCFETVDTMSTTNVEEVLLEIFPRKVSMDPDHCHEVIAEIEAFWRFVDRVYDVEHAGEIAGIIPQLADPFREAMSDPSNFGMAKSMFMMGDQAGFDMGTQDGLDEFVMAYNDSLLPEHLPEPTPPAPMSAEEKRLDRKRRKKVLAAKTRSKR